MVNNSVTKRTLKILIAKYIKGESRKFENNEHIKELIFTFITTDNEVLALFDTQRLILNGNCHISDLNNILEQAFKETNANGMIEYEKGFSRVVLYDKPVKKFIMLQNIIYKYFEERIDWNDVYTQYYENGVLKRKQTKYLCYDEDKINETIKFIRNNRYQKDILILENIKKKDFSLENNILIEKIGLKLTLETPNGKVKNELELII